MFRVGVTNIVTGGCENLEVYQRAISFLSLRDQILASIRISVSACDHLRRAGESIPLNIAHGSSVWTAKERNTYYAHASASALECAACMDILYAKNLVNETVQNDGKKALRMIVNMLIAMQHEASDRLCEAMSNYVCKEQGCYFDHEKLLAYSSSIAFIAWITKTAPNPACSGDLLAKLDKSSTSVVLNIAEGNGRITNADKIKFFKTAVKANTQTIALAGIAYRGSDNIAEAQNILQTTGKCLSGLIKSKQKIKST